MGQAGTVVLSVRSGQLVVESVQPASGWTYATLRPNTQEARIDFRRSAPEQEASLHATVEGSQIDAEIEAPAALPDD